MTSFVRTHTSVEAVQFDGSRDSALAIASSFPFRIARHVSDDSVLMVTNGYDMTEVTVGDWVTVDSFAGVRVWTDQQFRALHRPFPLSSESQ